MKTPHRAHDPSGIRPERIQIRGPRPEGCSTLLTPEARIFLAELELRFGARRRRLLARRELVQSKLDAGWRPDFLAKTASVREADWRVAAVPDEIADRRVEITGPVDRRMVINALNSGARVYMADFEDSSSPTLGNMVSGQRNLSDAIRRRIDFELEATGKRYVLSQDPAVLFVRPRGLHLEEAHVTLDDQPLSGSLFDFGLYFFHNAAELRQQNRGIYFYLPKLQSHLEARFWNEVFCFAQDRLGIPRGTIKATVLIEHVLTAFEMDEVLYELREHSAGLNCGRWDYIFSFIKSFRSDPEYVLGDRSDIGMDRHFLSSYSRLLVATCHRRGAFAMGGMAAQIPIKNDEERNQAALAKVRADKRREARAGYDGTWVAHPALIPTALEEFDAVLSGPNQLDVLPEVSGLGQEDLLRVPGGAITEEGLRQNLRVGTTYLAAWLSGNGCIPIDHLMEDAATAEISRTQVWQWLQHGASLDDGRKITRGLVERTLREEVQTVLAHQPPTDPAQFASASSLILELVTNESLADFLTLPAYERLSDITDRDTRNHDMSIRPNQNGNLPRTGNLFGETDRGIQRRKPAASERFKGITRDFTMADVEKLRGSLKIEYTLADRGARRLWEAMHQTDYVNALGALTGNQAMQMAKAGLQAIYLSGWQVAADANVAGQMYPDQSLYPANSVPTVVKRINQTLQRADQIAHMEGDDSTDWFVPIVADAEAGFGGPLNAFELMKGMIEAGAAGVHFEDQLASEKKCGHLGGKVLVPTQAFIRTLNAARLAADVCDVPTILIARTDAQAANLLTSDVDERDHAFLTGERTPEGFFHVKSGLDSAIARGLSYAPYADLVWCETSTPDLAEAKRFAEAIHAEHPGKLLAYNCSPSFNWKQHLDDHTISVFQRELGAMGYAFQFVTLAGFHALNHSMFELAKGYRNEGMSAYSRLQQAEFASEASGYTATRHQHEVGTSYFDGVSQAVSKGKSSTTAMEGSTESAQF